MVSNYLLLYLPLFAGVFSIHVFVKADDVYPFSCSSQIQNCSALLYHIDYGVSVEKLASIYSINSSQIRPIRRRNKQDYLIQVPCSCEYINAAVGSGYFYNTSYIPQAGETFGNISSVTYSGQVLAVGGEDENFKAGIEYPMHIVCGCVESESQVVVTYTVQQHDTLSDIATLFSAEVSGIESMNPIATQNPSFIDLGWVLFVPMEKSGIPAPSTGRRHRRALIIGVLSGVTVLSVSSLIIILLWRRRYRQNKEENPKAAVSKSMSASRNLSLHNQFLHTENMEDMTAFESERPVVYALEEIEEATNNFDNTRIIGVGGFGKVYFGVLGEQEVAIKKMRSNKSKEFFAELKVLCKIHHINVVELLGYASGDDHLYLVYEYVHNGSLSDHLHDPLLKGHQPLSWTARTQIALDAAKGIEYIHDHTKSRYVHRDIKTTNILLDEGLRAKVADFGLAKLVGRTNDEDFIATRLVGTPGYLPPESVKELQVTPKTDVFAFGVVLAELITGQRALFRDNSEPSKMKSLITVINKIFRDNDPETALEAVIDGTLKGSYSFEDVYKMAEMAEWCLSENAADRPEMREIVVTISHIVTSSMEWEASLGGDSQVFSGVFTGR